MKRWWLTYRVAVRFALIEQARSRLAMVILVIGIPVWSAGFYHLLAADGMLRFFVRPAGHAITIHANIVVQISAALQVVGLLTGYMSYLSTLKSGAFDRRLVQAGCPRTSLVLAKLTTLALASAVVAIYTTTWMRVFWQPRDLLLLIASFYLVALIYGGLGVILAGLVHHEAGAFYLLIFISSIDLAAQNPMATATAGKPELRVLPGYGPMQSAVVATQLDMIPARYLALGLAWVLAAAAISITAFLSRTRSHHSAVTTPATDRTRVRA